MKIIIIFCFLLFHSLISISQIILLPGSTIINFNSASTDPNNIQKINIKLVITGPPSGVDVKVNFIYNHSSFPANSSLLYDVISVTPKRWDQLLGSNSKAVLDTFLLLNIPQITTPIGTGLVSNLSVSGQPAVHEIRLEPIAAPTAPKPKDSLIHGAVILKSQPTNLQPLFDKKSLPKLDSVHVLLKLYSKPADSLPNSDVPIIFNFISYDLKNNPEIINQTIKISPDRWKTIKNSGQPLDTFFYISTTAINDTSDYDEEGHVVIKSQPDSGYHIVRFTTKGALRTNPFWIEMGTNFDLLEKIRTNNFYSGVYMFAKDVAWLGNNKLSNKYKSTSKFRHISLTAGVYESKSVSFSTTSDSGFIYRDATSFVPLTDTARTPNYPYYRYYRDIGSITTNTEVNSIGLFFSPYLRMNSTPTDQNGFHWFLSLYAEMLWQRVKTTFDYSKATRDSTFLTGNLNEIYRHNFKESSVSSDYRSHYFGIGIPIYYKENRYNLYLNTVFGASNQKFTPIQSNLYVDETNSYIKNYRLDTIASRGIENNLSTSYAELKRSWNPFYMIQFRLTEDKYGISFTGEVRGIMRKEAKPIISLALSKKFDVAELFQTIVKPFSSTSETSSSNQ